MNTDELVVLLVQTKAELDAITKKYEELEARVKETMENSGVSKVVVDNHVINLVESKRRSFDVDLLKELVSVSVFNKVTTPTVKTSLFDAAVAMGSIKPEQVEKVVSVTPYKQLRVK